MNREFILQIPKTIDSNGCWIPELIPYDDGYCHIKINTIRYSLHRLSMCIFYGIDYHNHKIDTRHSKNCNRACFNPDHLSYGSCSDNINDQVVHGVCPKCGNGYRKYKIKSGPRKGQFFRECAECKNEARRKRYHGNT